MIIRVILIICIKIIASHLFEGFLCNDKTDHYWEYTVE